MGRREFLAATVAAAGAFPAFAATGTAAQPPNVVYIICDQMRGDALSCLGSPNARTPNLDRLAAGGVLFDRWFSNNPVCAPSRVTAFGGQHPHTHGKLTNGSGDFLKSLDGTLLGHFRERGYRLGWVGKNHTFEGRVFSKLDTAHIRAREPFRKYTAYVPPWWHSDMYWPEEDCFASLNTDESVAFINDAKPGEPFFLHVSYFDPHPPYFAPSAFSAQFNPGDLAIPPHVPPEDLSDRLAAYARAMCYDQMTESDLRETMRYYYASIAWGVDHQVGQVMKALEDKGLMDNTVVVFTSDHGDFMGHCGMVRKGIFHYDALLHVPMIWHAPGRIEAGLRVTEPCQCVDLFPSLVDISGGDVPDGLPGRSVKPLLHGDGPLEEDRVVFASAAYGDLPDTEFALIAKPEDPIKTPPLHTQVMDAGCEATHRTAMARTSDWKLILNENDSPELYHMGGGTVERKNIVGDSGTRSVRRRLEKEIRSIWKW
ncbi:MAG: sulfatase-like hydrolase/transferase [bacterium]|nr:sulfatase-like hydrolase/transferase [bacterium]